MNKIINIIICIIIILFYGLVIITGILPNFIIDTKIMLGCLIIPIVIVFLTMIMEIRKSKNENEKIKIKKFWTITLFCMYCISLISILFLKNEYRLIDTTYNINPFSREHFETVNIIPFKTIVDFFNNWNIKVFILNIGVNILLFMPMGIFIPSLFKKNIKNLRQFILIIIVISLIVEILQFITFRGSADIDDIILNVFGAVISYLLSNLKIFKKYLI